MTPSGWTIDTLKEHYDRLLEDLEKRYDEKFLAQKSAVDAAFVSSQKAIDKSDESLKEYKATANEFRKTISDYRDQTISKAEHRALETILDSHAKQIAALQVSEGRGEGNQSARGRFTATTISIIGLVIVVLGLLVTILYNHH